MPWQYQQTAHTLSFNGELVSSDCYSGNGEGFNNHSWQDVEGTGPLPCGTWFFTGPLYSDPKLGPDVLKLVPDAATRAFVLSLGRDPDSFRCHGKPLPPADINSGSDGCLCADKPVRIQISETADNLLVVVP